MTELTIRDEDLLQIVKTEVQKVLFLVADQYKINQQDILEKIFPKWKCNLTSTYSDILKNKKMRPINPENFCFARKPNLERCTRNRKKGIEYCASHQYDRPYGRIDDEPTSEMLKKKKGNQKCQVMIKVQPKMIAEKQYFIDNKNHLYITEKVGTKLKYRWIGDLDTETDTIKPKDLIKSTNSEFTEPKESKESKAKEPKSKEPKSKEPKSKEPKLKESKSKDSKVKDSKVKDSKVKESKDSKVM